MAKRLLVTGGTGFVAGSVIVQGTAAWEVHALSRSVPVFAKPGLIWHQVNGVARADWETVFRDIAPCAVIHTTAMADIDYCEEHEEACHAVNTRFTAELAEAAAGCGAKFVYCSTDNVFDGEQGPYGEDDPCAPVNYYGRSKRLAEQAAESSGADWAVARLSLVMGLPIFGKGNAFLTRMLSVLNRDEVLGVPPAEIRSPIDVISLGKALLELAENDFTGYLHLAGNDILPRVELLRRIAARFGYPPELIEARDPQDLTGRAPRPRDVSLLNHRARQVLRTPFCGVDEGLDHILSKR